MKNKSSKVLTGCGIVFGIFVVILVLIGFGIYTFVKNASEKREEIVQLNNYIEEKYGKVEDFVPPKENVVDSVKFVLFVDLRDSLSKYDDEITENLTTISAKLQSDEKEDLSFFETLGVMKTGLDLVPTFFEYVKKRNELLIKYNLSLGDYFYYYVLAYYSFLNKPVNDGPPFNLIIRNNENGAVVTFKDDVKDKDPKEYMRQVKKQRRIVLKEKINKMFAGFLENRLADIDSAKDIYKIYSVEVSELKENKMRIPWANELPENVKSFFKRFDLENTYNPQINSIEMELILND